MTITEVFKNPIIHLPLEQEANKSFRETLFEKFDLFLSLIRKIDRKANQNDVTVAEAEIIRTQNLIDALKKTINSYLRGNPSVAYQELEKALEGYQSIMASLKKN